MIYFYLWKSKTTLIITFKVKGMKKEKIKEVLKNIVLKFWDIRQS